ncbi:uncharacterized protein N0V89_001973 [Didymosphaeria variabile]|uniref:Uncharacterized protein n=1 Tax=Didymosphaeria variabile TaxID=1932322 RepID=A0A9W9CE88_9PLEO|nr:uncharacterized protein N0V89_001973 [Didymosphaeria variabile]KAJ4357398.1 hypothetical protein N0V89_001973 [Didymosphaeria variabile]
MRYTAASLCLALAAVQAAPQLPGTPGMGLPYIPVLPLKGVPDVLAGNGYNSIAASLSTATSALGIDADAIAGANAKLTGNVSVNPPDNLVPVLDVVKAVNAAQGTFWQLATDLEKKVCSVATSINQQNFAVQQANLIAAIQAQVTAIATLQANIQATIADIQKQIAAFSASEMSIVAATVNALAAAAVAASVPLTTLAIGLKNAGISSITDAANSLDVQSNALASFAGGVNFVGA